MADPTAVKRALARLAAPHEADRTVVERADAARRDLERAATFVERVGLPRLRRAVDRLDGAERGIARGRDDERGRDAEVGRAALAAFERYRAVARGERGRERERERDHFRSARATDLGPDSKRVNR
ncbi:hypothetical protein [Halomarina ordinaria]|uniref:Uncharacterized protein n=1 Tax=Halomarina ordinaria TaxID=3033939 RepID=A0ABD5UBS8_9EURY|nr:hypothetical protein [Halomarina sp. PSRA2]